MLVHGSGPQALTAPTPASGAPPRHVAVRAIQQLNCSDKAPIYRLPWRFSRNRFSRLSERGRQVDGGILSWMLSMRSVE